MDVRIIRDVGAPSRFGPDNGQYALQRALRDIAPDWLKFGDRPEANEMPWFWCWHEGNAAVGWEALGRPYVIGPNIFFHDHRNPGGLLYERRLLDAKHCRAIFTESPWYARLIDEHRAGNTAPIEIWPYPIDPMPEGPLEPQWDVLVFEKGNHAELESELMDWFGDRAMLVKYGSFRRSDLLRFARLSRSCIYLSDSDRGPLALAEILCAGCPATGIEVGAPWCLDSRLGVEVQALDSSEIFAAVERLWQMDRAAVRAAACGWFSPARVARQVLGLLDAARQSAGNN